MIWYVIVVVAAFLGGALFGGWKVDEWLRKEHLKDLEYRGLIIQRLGEYCADISDKCITAGGSFLDIDYPTRFSTWIKSATGEVDKILKERK